MNTSQITARLEELLLKNFIKNQFCSLVPQENLVITLLVCI